MNETPAESSNILDIIETLDPETGQYSIQAAPASVEEENCEIEGELEEGYMILQNNSDLDMPSLGTSQNE